MSANVTRLGVCSGAYAGSVSMGGDNMRGAVQAGRSACEFQEVGAALTGAITGLSGSSCVGAASGDGGAVGGGSGAGRREFLRGKRKGTRILLEGGCRASASTRGGHAGPALGMPGPDGLGCGGRGSPVPQWTIAALVASRRMRSSGDRSSPCSATHHASACAGVSFAALCQGGLPERSCHVHIRDAEWY
eukprot:6473019-Amphidinium_carterae.1